MKLHRSWVVLAVGTFATFAVSASAQKLGLKPGLWEIKHKMASAGGQMEAAAAKMQQQLASMPPERRKMMEGMMAKQGVNVGAGGVETSAKVCMTKEMVEQDQIPLQQGNCTTTSQSRAGNTVKMSFACTDPASSGEGQFTIVSPEAYMTKMAVRTAVQGRPETMNMDASGRWLGEDCGNVKPMTQRAP